MTYLRAPPRPAEKVSRRSQAYRRYGINPQEYLTDILQRLPSMTTSQLPQLLPHRWKPSQQ